MQNIQSQERELFVISKYTAHANGLFIGPEMETHCAVGKGSLVPVTEKKEGDGASPIGAWKTRRLFYRPDRVIRPETGLPIVEITTQMGWCDDPDHPSYNTLVSLPFEASHERMWRDDHVYDVVVELGYNDDPIMPHAGSAIFMHIARPDFKPTEGCVALILSDMLTVCANLTPESVIAFST
ncbi:MAG: L,D-transpeptidase family protein [Hyphomonas sp.]